MLRVGTAAPAVNSVWQVARPRPGALFPRWRVPARITMLGGMNLGQLGMVVWSGRWRVLLCALACLAGALIISARMQKSYEAKARVLLELVGADPVTGLSIGNKQTEAYVQTQQLLATSSRVAEHAIDKLGWADNPAVTEAWQRETGGNGDVRAWAAQRLLGAVGAYPLEGGGVMEIAYRAPDPSAAESIVRALRESYIETALALQTEAAARRAARFAILLKPAQAVLAKAQAELDRAQRETGTVLTPGGTDIAAGQLGSLGTMATNTELLAQRDTVNAALRSSSIAADTFRRDLIGLEQQIALAERTMGPDNPSYQLMLTRRQELIRQLSREMAKIRAGVGLTASAARQLAEAPQQAYLVERARVLGRAPENLRISQARARRRRDEARGHSNGGSGAGRVHGGAELPCTRSAGAPRLRRAGARAGRPARSRPARLVAGLRGSEARPAGRDRPA